MRAQSHIFSNMLGSVNGITYYNGKYHQINARQRTIPVDPNTTNQAAVRSSLAKASGFWGQATDATRTGWEDYADTLVYPSPMGSGKRSGRLVFIGNLTLASYIEARELDDIVASVEPPTIAGFLPAGPVTPTAPVGPGTGVGVGIQNLTGEDILAFAEISFGFNDTRNSYKGPFRSSTAIADEISSSTSGVIEFLGLEEGLAYFVRVRCISSEQPFRISSEYIIRGIAEVVAAEEAASNMKKLADLNKRLKAENAPIIETPVKKSSK